MSVRSSMQTGATWIGAGASITSGALLMTESPPNPQESSFLKTIQAIATVISIASAAYLAASSNPGNVKERVDKALIKFSSSSETDSVSGVESDTGEGTDPSPIETPLKSTSHSPTFLAGSLGGLSAISLLVCQILMPGVKPGMMALTALGGLGTVVGASAKITGDREIDRARNQIFQRILQLKLQLAPGHLGSTQGAIEKNLQEMTIGEDLETLATTAAFIKATMRIHRAATPARPRGAASTLSEGSKVGVRRTLFNEEPDSATQSGEL